MSHRHRNNAGDSDSRRSGDGVDQQHHGVRKITIETDHAGQRLDNFLFGLASGVPKGHVHRIIRTGQVRVNGGRIKATYRLNTGDLVRVPPMNVDAPDRVGVPEDLVNRLCRKVLFENDRLLVIDKPEGLAVQRGSGLRFGLIDALRQGQQSGVLCDGIEKTTRLDLVHRLDRGTSGCLIIGKGLRATRDLQALFRQHQVKKSYLALVTGRWEHDKTVDLPLASNQVAGGERVVKVADSGKSAISHFKVLDRYEGATLVQVSIETGRTHQIRVHAASQGHAIVGDQKYGGAEENKRFRRLGLKRLYLHATTLSFEDEEKVAVESTPDTQWINDLNRLSA